MKRANIAKLLVFGLLVIPALEGCKKGEEDGMSLKSRKSRVDGEWTVSTFVSDLESKTVSTNSGGSSTSTTTNTIEVDGSDIDVSIVEVSSGSSTTLNGKGDVDAYTFIFDKKDGTYTSTFEYSVTYTIVDGSGTTTVIENVTKEESGTWNFLGKVEDEYKNKERLALNVLASNDERKYTSTFIPNGGGTSSSGSWTENSESTYVNGENAQIWKLIRLAGKELKAQMEVNNETTNTSTNAGGTDTDVTTTEGMIDIFLTQGEAK